MNDEQQRSGPSVEGVDDEELYLVPEVAKMIDAPLGAAFRPVPRRES